MVRLLMSIVLLAFGLSGYAQNEIEVSPDQKIEDQQWQTYASEVYSIEFPQDWTLDESGRVGAIFMLFANRTSAEDDFSENVNLVIEDLSGMEIGLKEY